jgi:precorrin-6B methylase 2
LLFQDAENFQKCYFIFIGGSAQIVQVLMACLLSLTGHGRIEVITVNMIVATLQKLSLK